MFAAVQPPLNKTPTMKPQPAGQPAVMPNANIFTPANGPAPGDFQRFEDSAMQSAQRHLDPVWDRNQKTFEQSMVNKGLAPDSAAYKEAFDNFSRAKNDQYSSAAFGAQQYGLGAQNQAFNQGFQTKEADRAFDLNETNMLAGLDMAYGDRDFRDQQYNDSRGDMQYNRLASILAGLSQQATPQIDVMGAYGLNTSANNANYAAKMGGYNTGLSGMANLGGSLINLWGMS